MTEEELSSQVQQITSGWKDILQEQPHYGISILVYISDIKSNNYKSGVKMGQRKIKKPFIVSTYRNPDNTFEGLTEGLSKKITHFIYCVELGACPEGTYSYQ